MEREAKREAMDFCKTRLLSLSNGSLHPEVNSQSRQRSRSLEAGVPVYLAGVFRTMSCLTVMTCLNSTLFC